MAEPKLTPQQKDAIAKWISEKGSTRPCPFCGNPNWMVGDALAMTTSTTVELGINLSHGYPCVVLFCSNCSFMRFHSAIATGLMIPPKPQGEQQEEKRGA